MLKSGALVLFLAVAASQFHLYQCVLIIGTGVIDNSACPITYFGVKHSISRITIADPHFKICGIEDNPDCLLLEVPGVEQASVEVVSQGPGLGSPIHQMFHDIQTPSPCMLKIQLEDSSGMTLLTFLPINFGKQTVVQLIPTSLFTLTELNVTSVLQSNPTISTLYKLSDWKDGVLIESSGCRMSGLLIPAGNSRYFPYSCSDAVCSPTADLTINNLCGPTEICNLNLGCVPNI